MYGRGRQRGCPRTRRIGSSAAETGDLGKEAVHDPRINGEEGPPVVTPALQYHCDEKRDDGLFAARWGFVVLL